MWQVFRINELRVSVSIPPTLKRVDAGDSESPLAVGGGDTLAVFRSTLEGEPATDVPAEGCSIYIGIEDNSLGLPLAEWILTQSYQRPEDVDEEIQLGGITAIRRTGRGEIFGDPFTIVFVPHGAVIFTLTLEARGNNTVIEQCGQEFDQVVNSFHVGG